MATMQALNYIGPFKVKVEEVEKPRLEHPDDIIVKVTTVGCSFIQSCFFDLKLKQIQAAICGSDLQYVIIVEVAL